MGITRRNMFRFVQAATAVVVVPGRSFSAGLASLSRRDFQGALNSRFRVVKNGKVAWLTLLSVEDFNHLNRVTDIRPPRTDTFILHFSSTDGSMTQDTYSMSHSGLGDFDLFLVPEGAQQYSAVINRMIRQDAHQ